ncbi:Protein-tyrosine phosphatase family protein [Brugia pahangi]
MMKNGNMGPVCLLCPTGVHRSGTYAILDIVLDRVTAEKKVGLLETASIVRKQRYGCMSYYSHYSHVADLVVRYAIATGIVDIGQIKQQE